MFDDREMGKEVPIILAIRMTVVPIIFAIRKRVDRTIPGRRENSTWYLQSICYTIGYKFLCRANNCCNSHDRRAVIIGNRHDVPLCE